MMTEYLPELAQAAFAPHSVRHFDVPEYVDALVDALLREFSVTYWNHLQVNFPMDESAAYRPEVADGRYPILNVPGLQVRSFWWGDEDDEVQAGLPNFAFEDVAINWYKHPGRGMSANVEKDPAQWVAWFDRALAAIRSTPYVERMPEGM